MFKTQDLHVREIVRLPPPRVEKAAFPATPDAVATVAMSRERIVRILNLEDPRLLVVVGPCSIHDDHSALEYAARLNVLRKELADRMEIVMRVYFEKPRTTIGWMGLINDPHLDDSQDIETGLKIARLMLVQIAGMGLPAATEFLDPIVPQYIADLVSWAAIGARPRNLRRIARWRADFRCRSATRTPRTADCRWPLMQWADGFLRNRLPGSLLREALEVVMLQQA